MAARPSFAALKRYLQSDVDEILVFKGLVNGWLVHYTHAAEAIMREGFRGIGSDHLTDLGWTWGLAPQDTKVKGGYSFAYLPRDAVRAFGLYGHDAILFRARGVVVYNKNDDEVQVVFVGSEAKDLEYVANGGPERLQKRLMLLPSTAKVAARWCSRWAG